MSYRDNYPVGDLLVKTADSPGAGGTELAELQPPEGEEWIPIYLWGWQDDVARDCYWQWYDVKTIVALQGPTYVALGSFARIPLFAELAAVAAVVAGSYNLFTPKITHRSYPRLYGLLLTAGKKTHIASLCVVRSGLA